MASLCSRQYAPGHIFYGDCTQTLFNFIESLFSTFVNEVKSKTFRELASSLFVCIFVLFIGWYLSALDNVFLAIYFMEIVLKLYALRSFFFTTGWNIMGMANVLSCSCLMTHRIRRKNYLGTLDTSCVNCLT